MGSKTEWVRWDWSLLHNEDWFVLLTKVYSVVKLRIMIWPGHVVHRGGREVLERFWWRNGVMDFYVYVSVYRWSILIIVQRDATQSSLFITLQFHAKCFGCQQHPSSGVHKTVTTASCTGHIFCAAISLQRGQSPIIRSTQNCNYSLRYWSYFFVQLPPSNVAKLPSSRVHKTVTTASGTGHIFCSSTSLQRGQTPIIRNTQNCNYSLRYWSYFLCSYLTPTWPTWPRWREGAAQQSMTSTGGCSYSFVYSWWWVCLTPETCRVNLQNNK